MGLHEGLGFIGFGQVRAVQALASGNLRRLLAVEPQAQGPLGTDRVRVCFRPGLFRVQAV